MTTSKRPERRGGLGRGIGSLIPEGDRNAVDVFFGSDSKQPIGVEVAPGARLAQLNLDQITPNPQQPRTVFEADAFAELVHLHPRIRCLAAYCRFAHWAPAMN